MRTVIAVLLALAASLVCATTVSAQSCTSSITPTTYGSVDLLAGSPIDTMGNISISCTGTANTTVYACPTFAAGTGGSSGDIRFMSNGASGSVSFNLFIDSGRSQIWGGSFGSTTAPIYAVALNGSGNGSVASTTIYGRIYGGQSMALAGSYTSDITATTFTSATPATCSGTATAASLLVTATYAPTCTLSTATLDFGNITSLASAVDGQTNLTVACSNGSPYSIALDGGLSLAADPTLRRMTRSSSILLYGLYRDGGRTLPWGSTTGAGGNILGSTGTGSGQIHPVYGRVNVQSVPPPGTYTDTIVVTVTN